MKFGNVFEGNAPLIRLITIRRLLVIISSGKHEPTWNIPGPLHSAEEQPGGELADVVDADHVVGSHLNLNVN